MVKEKTVLNENKNHLTELAKAKALSRTQAKKMIKEIPSDLKEELSFRIQENIKQLLNKLNIANSSTKVWAAFQALPSEPAILWSSIQSGIEWCFPETKDEKLCFVNADKQVRALSDIGGIVVPALAFNENGARLGRGMGFYDKTLANYAGVKVGVAYDFNVTSQIPYESHDVKMNYIVTEHRIVEVGA